MKTVQGAEMLIHQINGDAAMVWARGSEQKELVDREAAQHRAMDAEKATRGVGRGFNPARGGSLPGAARCVII